MKKVLMLTLFVQTFLAEAGLNMCTCPLSGNGRLTLESGQVIEFTSAKIMMAIDGGGRCRYPFPIVCKNGQDTLLFNYGYDGANDENDSVSLVKLEDMPHTGDVWIVELDRSYELRVARTNMEYEVTVVSDMSAALRESLARRMRCPWPRSLEGLPIVYEGRSSTYRSFPAETNSAAASCRSSVVKTLSKKVELSDQTRHEMSKEEIFATFLGKTNDCEMTVDRIRNISTAVYAENGRGRFIVACDVFDDRSGKKIMGGIGRGSVGERNLSERELAIEGVSTNGTESLKLYLRKRVPEDLRSTTWPWTIEIRYEQGGKCHVLSTF